ncbi:MAG: LamG domain-containing protein, partial [Herbaspirillum sp.]|nr:LamG domain-containing protein [Herbaspirillum sp.]
DGDGIPDGAENRICTDAYDADTDDDGISDGNEDMNRNGKTDTDETDPCSADTDGDGVQDGTEIGMTAPDTSDTDTGIFIADENPSSVTDPLKKDCDGDGLPNGYEDANFNGKYEPELGETDPNSPDTGIWPVLLVTGEEQITGSTFTESSPYWRIVTAAGCEKQAVAALGDYSWKFGGYDSFLEISDSDDFTLGAGDFTIDFRMKSDSNGNLMGHGAWNSSGDMGWTSWHSGSRYRNKVCALFSKDGTDGNSISLYVSVAIDNEWHHIAVTRSGSIFMMSADGQAETSVTYDGALYDSSEVLKIGSSDNWNAAEGYLDQIRSG